MRTVYSRELADLNTNISNRISLMEDFLTRNSPTEELQEFDSSARSFQPPLNLNGQESATESDNLLSQPEYCRLSEKPSYSHEKIRDDVLCEASGHSGQTDSAKSTKSLVPNIFKLPSKVVGSVFDNAKVASKVATHAVGSAVNLVSGGREYEFYSGGFVSYRTLSLKYAALQMLHHDTPFLISVSEAPDPEDVFWTNVGREHEELQVGILLSRAASVAICFVWTIPITFIASLSTVEGLKRQFSFVGDAIEAFPALEPMLQQLAPLLIVLANVMYVDRLTGIFSSYFISPVFPVYGKFSKHFPCGKDRYLDLLLRL